MGILGEGLKQRLIGAVVLLTLLIIIAPALFRGGETHPLVSSRPSSKAPVLEPPPVPAFVDKLSVVPDVVEVISTSSESTSSESTSSVSTSSESTSSEKVLEQDEMVKPVGVDEEGHLKAWSLQLATFADKNNARNLEGRLKEQGYRAYLKKIATEKGKIFYRVYIGPEARPDELQQIKVAIRNSQGLDGIVVRFVP